MVTRVEQTYFAPGTEGEIPGNCLQASVASILDLPLDAVPHFILFGDEWWYALNIWLEERGLFVNATKDMERDKPVLAFGKSPRGDFSHAIVLNPDGTYVDPHPDQTGLIGEPEELYYILKEGE